MTDNACTSEKQRKIREEQRVEKRIPTGIREDLVGRHGDVKEIIERSEAKATHKNLATPVEEKS